MIGNYLSAPVEATPRRDELVEEVRQLQAAISIYRCVVDRLLEKQAAE